MDPSKAFVAWLGTDGALRHKSPVGLLRVEGWPKLRAWRQCSGTPRRWLPVTPLISLTQTDDPARILSLGAARCQHLPFDWSPFSQAEWDEIRQTDLTPVVVETDEEADALLKILPPYSQVVVVPPGSKMPEEWTPSTATGTAIQDFLCTFPDPVRTLVGEFQTCSQWNLCRFLADDITRVELGKRCAASLFQAMLEWMHTPTPPLAPSVTARIPAHQCCVQLFRWLGSLEAPALEALQEQTVLGCSTALAAMFAQRKGRRLRTEHLRLLDSMEQWEGPWRHPPTTILLTEELTLLIRHLR